jgi:type II secretory pathway component GspD/PulD (secretin)
MRYGGQRLRAFQPPRQRLPSQATAGTSNAYGLKYMKTLSFTPFLSIFLTAAWTALAAPDDAGGLLLDFHEVPLQAVLNFLSEKAGLIVVSEAEVKGAVTLTASQPVSTDEAVNLLNDQLSRNNDTAVLDGRTLTVMEAPRARTSARTPVLTVTNVASMPVNNVIVTAILPVHSLNPAQLIKDLEPLIAEGDTVTANEAGNAVVMTATQKNIHRIASIIAALDRTAVYDITVIPLNYADSKSVADELKLLFQSDDAQASRTSAQPGFGPRFGGFNGEASASATKEKTAPTKPVFVADEQMNALAVSAPPDDMSMIARVVNLLDRPGEEVAEVEMFALQHADPGEVVDEISSLFSQTTGTADVQPLTRPLGLQFAGAGITSSASRPSTDSSRLKGQSAVTAVADRRTQSVLVTASQHAMEQIKKLVARLDVGLQGVMKVSVFEMGAADAGTVQDAMATIFPGSASATHSQGAINTLLAGRLQAAVASQSTATSATAGSSSSLGSMSPAR